MPIEVYCDSCQKKLRVPDTAAGKRIKCPKCQGVISVPVAASSPAPTPTIPTPTKTTPSKPASSISTARPLSTPKSSVGKAAPQEQWHVQTEDGEQYGPVSRPELDQWHADGRITVDTQLLRDGGDQWQWASDIYPDLAPADPTPASTGGIPDFGALASSSSAPTSGSGAFDFSASSAGPSTSSGSVASRGKKKTKGRKSASAGTGEVGTKSKMVAILLALFAGGLGGHRFYLGYTGLGIAMLCTCGGCGIWSLIELVMILTGKIDRDADGKLLKE